VTGRKIEVREAKVTGRDRSSPRHDPPAKWLWLRLRELNPRADTDIILISPSRLTEIGGRVVSRGGSIASSDLRLPNLDFPTSHRVSSAAYWRLAASRLLADRYRRLLYIDIDTLPADAALFDAFDYDMRAMPIAAAREVQHFRTSEHGRVEDGEVVFDRYFNSGVQLIDTERFVAADLEARVYEVIQRHGSKLRLQDQSALNLAIEGQWAELSPAYNFWPGALGTIMEARCTPRIIHYYGETKPWSFPSPYRTHREQRRLRSWLLQQGELRFLLKGIDGSQWGEVVRDGMLGREPRNGFINEGNAPLMCYLESDFVH